MACKEQGKYYTQAFKSQLIEAGWDVRENNQDEQDKTPDLYLFFNNKIFVPFEIKSLTTPFRSSERLVKIPPEKCITLQTVEFENCYNYDPTGLMGFHVDFTPEFPTSGQYWSTVREINLFYQEAKQCGRVREIYRAGSKKRRLFYFSLDHLKPLSELLELSRKFHEVSDELLTLLGLVA